MTLNPNRHHVERVKSAATFVALVLCSLLAGDQRLTAQAPTLTATFVQWACGDAGAETTDTTYFGNSVTPGHVIVALAHWNGESVTANVTDSHGNKYLPLTEPLNAGGTERIQAWYAKDVRGGGSFGLTIHFSKKTQSFSVIAAIEYAGLDRAAPLIATVSASGMGNHQASGPLNLSSTDNCLMVGLFGFGQYALPYKTGDGFLMNAYEASTMVEEAPCSAIASKTVTASSSSAAGWGAIAIAFKTAAP